MRVSLAVVSSWWMVFLFLPAILSVGRAIAGETCCIRVIDKSNGWPVPLVELTTTNHVRFVTDNNGVIAFDLPELINVPTWFTVKGHGYEVPRDGFGFHGVRLVPRAGETLTVEVNRSLPGKRIGRITGGGLFAESQKLGLEPDWTEQGILGCDSVQNIEHKGLLYWGWGDTILPGYPLGIFHMIGATTDTKPLTSFQPPVRLRYNYVLGDDKLPRKIAELPGDGPTWLGGYASLTDKKGNQHLVATYAKIKPPLDAYEYGLCEWSEAGQRFEKSRVLWTAAQSPDKSPNYPLGHHVEWKDANGVSWMLFGDPFPTLMYPNSYEAWSDPSRWISLQPQAEVAVHASTDSVKPHRGAIAWNAYRKKWVTVFTQLGGKSSYLGELWYAEADDPTGPWSNALQIVTHEDYTFYNPQLHAGFTEAKSPILLFEATYTKEFSGNKSPTPRHDYNQVLYRIDLDEPAFQF